MDEVIDPWSGLDEKLDYIVSESFKQKVKKNYSRWLLLPQLVVNDEKYQLILVHYFYFHYKGR